MERRLITAALRRTNGDVPRAAALLEINPSTVYRKLQSWRAEGLVEWTSSEIGRPDRQPNPALVRSASDTVTALMAG